MQGVRNANGLEVAAAVRSGVGFWGETAVGECDGDAAEMGTATVVGMDMAMGQAWGWGWGCFGFVSRLLPPRGGRGGAGPSPPQPPPPPPVAPVYMPPYP